MADVESSPQRRRGSPGRMQITPTRVMSVGLVGSRRKGLLVQAS